MLSSNVYIHHRGTSCGKKNHAVQASVPSPHKETKPLYSGLYCAFQKNYSILFLWQGLPRLSETLKSDKQRFNTLPHSLPVSCILFWPGWCFIRTEKKKRGFCIHVSARPSHGAVCFPLSSSLITIREFKRTRAYYRPAISQPWESNYRWRKSRD